MLYCQLVTFLAIFDYCAFSLFTESPLDLPPGLNENEKNEFIRCVKKEEKQGPVDPPGACKSQCFLQATGSIGNDKINMRKIWEKAGAIDKLILPGVFRQNKEYKKKEKEFLKALEADCSSLKGTGRCELGKKVEDCFSKKVIVFKTLKKFETN
ncbi:uncharacterized protein LOC116655834 [Drosophila ananassae]|uniref:uncharacterized protein LOC116655834 n=1 Tax=Drosophila ananassae TaxID=7217 RepID=UPI001CFFEE57|nr:uncharacterized protein LOC116655834 [Drosophila ananassae]